MTPRLKEIFNKEIQPALKDQFGFKNIYIIFIIFFYMF